MSKIQYVVFSIALMGCAGFQNRTFIDEMDNQDLEFFVAGRDFNVTPGDTGSPYRSKSEILKRTPISGKSRENYRHEKSLQNELYQKEARLSKRESWQYRKVRPYLNSISEKIYFLELTRFEKLDYIESMGIDQKEPELVGRNYSNYRSLASLDPMGRKSREIEVGMNKEEVISTWGRPVRIEVAGNPRQENERWTFYDNGRAKQIYFEFGRVQGWVVP